MLIFYLLALIFSVIIITGMILVATLHRKNYWRRVVADITPCNPADTYEIQGIYGTRPKASGIISYSLYGNYRKYSINLLKSLRNIPKYLPGWQARVYVAMDIPESLFDKLLANGAEIILMGTALPKGHEAALWRFLPAGQDLPFVCLDADDVFDHKIAADIKNWLATSDNCIILHRHQFYLPMTAGMWGGRNCPVPDMKQRLDKYAEYWFGFDEAFLHKEIYPIVSQLGYWRSEYLPLNVLCGIALIIIVTLIILVLYNCYINNW